MFLKKPGRLGENFKQFAILDGILHLSNEWHLWTLINLHKFDQTNSAQTSILSTLLWSEIIWLLYGNFLVCLLFSGGKPREMRNTFLHLSLITRHLTLVNSLSRDLACLEENKIKKLLNLRIALRIFRGKMYYTPSLSSLIKENSWEPSRS